MLEIAQELVLGFEFARVDLYQYRGQVLFGEVTHYPEGGSAPFDPRDFDRAPWRAVAPRRAAGRALLRPQVKGHLHSSDSMVPTDRPSKNNRHQISPVQKRRT